MYFDHERLDESQSNSSCGLKSSTIGFPWGSVEAQLRGRLRIASALGEASSFLARREEVQHSGALWVLSNAARDDEDLREGKIFSDGP